MLAYLEESTTFTYKDPENTPQLWPFPGLSSISCLYSLCLIMVKKNWLKYNLKYLRSILNIASTYIYTNCSKHYSIQ